MAQRTGQNKVLGLAIGDRSLVVAEASRAGGPPRVTLAAPFPFPQGVGLDQPEMLGEALGQFLRDRGFAARQVVVGVPARWVLSKAKEVPPADPATVAEALRLQVEGEFTQELKNLTFDYAGETSDGESRTVLLVALQGKHLEQVKALAEAAKLQLAAVTPVGCVLGAATAVANGGPRQALCVSVGPGGVELAAVDGPAAPRVLRHLGGAAASPAMLAVELRRAAFALAGSGGGTGGGGFPRGEDDAGQAAVVNSHAANGHASRGYVNGSGGAAANGGLSAADRPVISRNGWHLVVWDGAALSDASRRALADAAGAKLETGDLTSLGVAPGVSGVAPDLAGAAALAVAALSDELLPADFLHSKLAEPKKSRVPPRTVLLSAAGALVVLLVGLYLWRLYALNTELADLTAQLQAKADDAKFAGEFVKKAEYVQAWQANRTRYIACWADLHGAIPGNSPDAYITNFTLRDDMVGTIRGKASQKRYADEVRDRLRGNKRFANVANYEVSESAESRRNPEWQFSLQFTYAPENASSAASKPATAPTAGSRPAGR